MTIAILATGDEIVHGDTLNTNGYEIAHLLSDENMSLGMHIACSDKEEDLVKSMQFLSQAHDILIIIGGLGPTSDDRTRFALAHVLNVPLVEHQEALSHLKARLSHAGLQLNQGNLQQTYFPAKATLLPNPYGTALGCHYVHQNKHFVLLPGPPVECLPMFRNYALPLIQNTLHSDKQIIKWRLFGVSEGAIAEKLDQALLHLNCKTGYRLERPYLEFKVRCHQKNIQAIKQVVEPIVKPYIIASPQQTASASLKKKIPELQQSIVIIDQVTGGLIQTLIQRPYNYAWLRFQDHADATWRFHLTGLEEYWQQHPEINTTQLTLHWQHFTTQSHETHTIPYYNPWVISRAAEWLCFRIQQILSGSHFSFLPLK